MFQQLKASSAASRRRRGARFSTAAASVAVLALAAAGAAAPGAGARPAHHRKAPISTAAAFALPAPGKCVKEGTIAVELRSVRHVAWTGAVVKINGRRAATISPSQVNRPVQVGGLPSGSIGFSITARTSDHRRVAAARQYHSCATKRPEEPKEPKQPQEPPMPPTSPTGPQPGLYRTNGGYPLFYVSADASQVQDVTKSTSLSCSTGGSIGYAISITDIPIAADGSFGATEVESTIISGKPATVTMTFNGDFDGAVANGSYREDIAYEDGSGKTCTTNTQSWPASLDTSQGSQTLAAPQPGLYRTNGGYPLFYVSPDRTHIQDVTKSTSLSCSTGASFGYSISIIDIPIEAQSTFATTSEENTIIAGKPVKVITTFKGHFHGMDGHGNQRAAGSYREDVVYEDGSGEKCTTGIQSWPGEVDSSQGSQVLGAPEAGLYRTNGGYPLFTVSADHAHIQNVTKSTSVSCDTGASFGSSIAIADIPIEGETTFHKTQVESGLIAGKAVTITVTFNGNFHGYDDYGNQRAAGSYREDIAYEDGSGEKCTTGTQSWPAGWSAS